MGGKTKDYTTRKFEILLFLSGITGSWGEIDPVSNDFKGATKYQIKKFTRISTTQLDDILEELEKEGLVDIKEVTKIHKRDNNRLNYTYYIKISDLGLKNIIGFQNHAPIFLKWFYEGFS